MRLLICAQAVDEQDPTLSFFVGWLQELSKHFERVTVFCLKAGTATLPANVTVHSLGKEYAAGPRSAMRFLYITRLWWRAGRQRNEYDAVFVHQSQEFVLAAGFLWFLFKKPVYLWRNHYAGSPLTSLAVLMSRGVFCTSRYSFTAKYKKTKLMPVGIDTSLFSRSDTVHRKPHSILFLGRFAPSKQLHVLLEALGMLRERHIAFTASFYGDALPRDEEYRSKLIERVHAGSFSSQVSFFGGVPHHEVPDVYRAHDVFVNLSRSGMLDKTIFEAAACGALVVASSGDYAERADARLVFDGTVAGLAQKIETVFPLLDMEKAKLREAGVKMAEAQSLTVLAAKLAKEIHA